MSEEEQHTLSEEQIRSDFRTNQDLFHVVLRQLDALGNEMRDADDRDQISVSVGALRTVRQGTLAMIKTIGDLTLRPPFGDSTDRGDRGNSCDYNPFRGVDTGDLIA